MTLVSDKIYEINDVDPIGYSEIWVDWSLRSSLTNDLYEKGTDIFEYIDDLSTGLKEGWELWACKKYPNLVMNVKVKYSSQGLPEEFVEADDLRWV